MAMIMRKRNLFPQTKREAEARKRARRVQNRVMKGESKTSAAKAEHTDLRTALKYLDDQLNQKISDSLMREMFVLTPLGPVMERIRGSHAASLNARHAAAVQHFLRSGDSSRLPQFQGKQVAGHELIVDTKLLSLLAEAGALRLDNLYSRPMKTS